MLTQDQIDSFHTQGFLIMRGLFQGEELRMLQSAAASVVAEGVSGRGLEHRYHVYADGRQVYWRSEQMWLRHDIFMAATVNPQLLENVGQCIGQEFYPWNDSLVVKLPESGAPVKWHQDPPYRNPDRAVTYPVPNFTTDIYLDRSWTGNGCVYAIPGRHLVGHVELADTTEEDLFREHGAVPLELEPGDVLFHCLSTPHGSRANNSDSIRRVFYIHYLAEAVYQDGYSREEWAALKPGWTPERQDRTRDMLRARERCGLGSTLPRPTLSLGKGGFAFTGAPITPRGHWAALAAAIPPPEREALKRLEPKSSRPLGP